MYNWWAQQRGEPWEGRRTDTGIRPTFHSQLLADIRENHVCICLGGAGMFMMQAVVGERKLKKKKNDTQ